MVARVELTPLYGVQRYGTVCTGEATLFCTSSTVCGLYGTRAVLADTDVQLLMTSAACLHVCCPGIITYSSLCSFLPYYLTLLLGIASRRANDAVQMLLDKIRNRNPAVALAALTVSLHEEQLPCFAARHARVALFLGCYFVSSECFFAFSPFPRICWHLFFLSFFLYWWSVSSFAIFRNIAKHSRAPCTFAAPLQHHHLFWSCSNSQ